MVKIEKGSVVQVTNVDHTWFPCLIVVDEVKSFGIQGYITLPEKGNAYIRLKKKDYEYVGEAHIIAQ